MLKRFYSKRSGFTLVEIVIAFAIFSIMAAMICQILDLSVSARRSNNLYQRELAQQEAMLTLIEKKSSDFKDEKGTIALSFTNGTNVALGYDMLETMSGTEFAGLSYYVSAVNYGAAGEIPPGVMGGGEEGSGNSGSNTGSQASRMNTRLTGTGGIDYINIQFVVKDDNDRYPDGSPYKLPEGYTRYFIRCSAAGATSLKDEDVPYSQYRLFFFDESKKNAAAGNIIYTDSSGKKYKNDVPAEAVITKVGYLNAYANTVAADGLKDAYIASTTSNNFNKYVVEQKGTNCVRIGSPFVLNDDLGVDINGQKRGVKFSSGNSSNFYIEVKGDIDLTTASFGNNAVEDTYGHRYTPYPVYTEEFDSDGNPIYSDPKDLDKYVNIYGANIYKRNYNVSSDTPEEGGDSE